MPESPSFINRETELALLLRAWDDARNGSPRLLILEADSGLGKTRLVQELYKRLSSDPEHDPGDYWPDTLEDEEVAMSLEPLFHELATDPDAPIPWLWLAVRCHNPDGRNLAFGRSPLVAARRQVRIHLAGLYVAKHRRARNLDVARSSLAIAANFAFPGLGGAVAVGMEVIEALDSGTSVIGAVRTLRDQWQTRRQDSEDAVAASSREERESLVDGTVDAIAAVCGGRDPADGIPVVLVVDDAHWADELTLQALRRLARQAAEGSWRLLMLLTAWEETLKAQAAGSWEGAGLDGLLTSLEEANEPTVRPLSVVIEPLDQSDGATFVKDRLPTIQADVAALLSRKAGGDLDLLSDYVHELRDTPGWLEGGRFARSAADLEALPSQKRELARRRLRTLGPETARLLAWGSAQGVRFYQRFLWAMARSVAVESTELEGRLLSTDDPMHITRILEHPSFERVAEFRRYVYYELSHETLERLNERPRVLRGFALALRDSFELGEWELLDPVEQADLADDLVFSIETLGLRTESDEWAALLDLTRGRLAALALDLGEFGRAMAIAEALVQEDCTLSRHSIRENAFAVLVEAAHTTGDTRAEETWLARWREQLGNEMSRLFLLRSANFATRAGRNQEAIELCHRALEATPIGDRVEQVRVRLDLAGSLWFAGRAPAARVTLSDVEHLYQDEIMARLELRVRLEHVSCVVLHDLERNDEVVQRSQYCVDAYRRLAVPVGYVRSLMNLGDGLWGAGRTARALEVARLAYEEARAGGRPHELNVAAACLANVMSATGASEEALDLYDLSIELAQSAGWVWDALYDDLYSTLHRVEIGACDAEALGVCAARAQEHGYAWLEAVGLGYLGMRLVIEGRATVGYLNSLWQRVSASWVPAGRAYLASSRVLVAAAEGAHDGRAARDLARALSECQGMKGRPLFIVRACDAIESVTPGGAEGPALSTWAARFRTNPGDSTYGRD